MHAFSSRFSSSRAIQSNGASDGTLVTSPLPTFGSQKRDGSIGISRPIIGAWHFFPSNSRAWTEPTTLMESFWKTSLSAHSLLIIQRSPSTSARTYVTLGFTQKFVWPKTVSGRSVAAMRKSSLNLNFNSVYSCFSAVPPFLMSVSEASTATGPQFTHAVPK